MGIPLVRGRDFSGGDVEALLVSASAAKLLWGNQDPIGGRALLPLVSRTKSIPVVGVVGDVKEQLAERAPPTIYYYLRDLPSGDLALAMKTSSDPASLAQAQGLIA